MAEKNEVVCPFLNSDPVYAFGAEFGMLFMRMVHGDEDSIREYFSTENQEQITLAANRLGWRIIKMKPWKKAPEHWTLYHLERIHAGNY